MDSDLVLRREVSGGPVRTQPAATNKYFFQMARRVILIHGFHTNEDDARTNYEAFKANADAVSPRFARDLLTMVWPSDEMGGNPVTYYAQNVERAEECAGILASFINEHIQMEQIPCEYILIAHSLGCRLAVNLIARLKALGVNVEDRFKLVLMAAAVPVEFMSAGEDLNRGVKDLPVCVALYSPADSILKRVFPLGEASGGIWMPEAVGLRGKPGDEVWSHAIEMAGFGHSDYWSDSRVPQSIAALLGYGTQSGLTERRQPTATHLEERGTLPERVMNAGRVW